MANALLESGLRVMEFSRKNLLGLAEDIPADKLCQAPSPGANHTLWVLGHMAWTDDFFAAQLGKQPSTMTEEWTKLFGMGSSPTNDAKAYPSLAQVKDALANARQRLTDWFKSLDDKALMAPLPSDFANFAPNVAGLMPSIAWHEGLHTGQVSACRRSLGLKPKMG